MKTEPVCPSKNAPAQLPSEFIEISSSDDDEEFFISNNVESTSISKGLSKSPSPNFDITEKPNSPKITEAAKNDGSPLLSNEIQYHDSWENDSDCTFVACNDIMYSPVQISGEIFAFEKCTLFLERWIWYSS
jgi:hypothetical protein